MTSHVAIWLATVAALATVACGSDGDGPSSSGGTGGVAGVAGASGASGGTGASGGSSGTGGTVDAGPPYKAHLSETGLYADLASDTVASDVEAYEPQFQLWSDGAGKRRWVSLPAGSQIDTTDFMGMVGMDYWRYPAGTRVWKEFSVAGARIETRMLEKTDGGWTMIAYQWRSDLSDADAVPDGVQNAAGTQHDIPSSKQCATCHSAMPDTLLGVTAIQLDHPGAGLTLSTLVGRGQLTLAPSAPLVVPGDATAQAALGYLHANCGHCHNPRSAVYQRAKMALWLETGSLATVQATPAYRTAVNQASAAGPLRIAPGDPTNSRVIYRMSSADPLQRMPPLATEVIDTDGVAAVSAWISAL